MKKQLFINTGRGYRLALRRSTSRKTNRDVIILCHGLAIDSSAPLMRKIRNGLVTSQAEVIQFDFAAHGRSGGRINDRRVHTFIEDLIQVTDWARKELKPDRLFIVGYSIGALTALLFASKYPRKVDGICIIGVNSDASEKLKQLRDCGLIKDMGSYGKIGKMSVAKDFWKDRAHYNVRDAARRLQVPVYFIAGSEDITNPASESKELYTLTQTKKKFTVIQGARHNFEGSKVISSLQSALKQWLHLHKIHTS